MIYSMVILLYDIHYIQEFHTREIIMVTVHNDLHTQKIVVYIFQNL